jgi:methionyl aminopeptidase
VDRRNSEFVISRGAYPVGINYYGFPLGLFASPNEVALHGVPNTRPLEEGDPEDEIGGNVLD